MEDKSQFAGFWKRFAAYCLDCTIVSIGMLILLLPLGIGLQMFMGMLHFDGMTKAVIGRVFMFLIGMPIWIAYFAIFEASAKQATPGKMALGIVVTDANGAPIGIGRAIGRQFGRILSGLFLNLGYIICGFTARRQCVHDMLAGTLVVNKDAPLRLGMKKDEYLIPPV
ncbi:MAG: RDD family protein [Cyanobacteria bacterium REEB67]|nr:RDD family protein [Cyanobacteria bacterium REEB67]